MKATESKTPKTSIASSKAKNAKSSDAKALASAARPSGLAPRIDERRTNPLEVLEVRGAREHNLKNVSIEMPKGKMVVFTGPSGSGKSSLAFDTIFAEGQRRYVESLSSYARQFLGQMEKPKYDTIRGLSPTISIEQKSASSNPRSTVGTVTEIHDYLRVLYARIGVQHCPNCGARASAMAQDQITEAILSLPEGTKIQVLAPLCRQRKGEHLDIFEHAQKNGFIRMRIDGKIVDLSDGVPNLDKKSKHDLDLIVDRIVIRESSKSRITDSLEIALREAKGTVVIESEGKDTFYSEKNACPVCNLSFPELAPPSFSFNSPVGFCPTCNGLGSVPQMDPTLVVPHPEKSLRTGAIAPWASAIERGEGWTAAQVDEIVSMFKIDIDKPFQDLTKAQKDGVLFGATKNGLVWEGLLNQLLRRMKATQSEDMKQYYMRYFSTKACTDCEGTRLRKESRAVLIEKASITDLSHMPVHKALAWVREVDLHGQDAEIAKELRREIENRLGFLVNVGLQYLTLDRAAATLSGGESQRIRLASQIGSELTGVLYILDEPSIGLHPRDNDRLIGTLKTLRDLGNSVLVVEHDEDTMRAADYIFDFGPGAGEHGGDIIAHGSPEELLKDPKSVTGGYLSGRRHLPIPNKRRKGTGQFLEVIGASEHNLQNVDAKFPVGTLVAVAGVSGAGKSTLINRILYPALAKELFDSREQVGAHKKIKGLDLFDKVVRIDQSPIGRTPRSNPATYTKVFDSIRELYASTQEARTFGYDAGRFSFNVKGGRCEACSGDGLRKVEMHFLPDVYVTCEICGGKRFNASTLRVTYKGKTISDTLEMSVDEGVEHFALHRDIHRGLRTLQDVGLGYLKIGQPSPTLSGGEAQRIKLARELSRVATGKTVYILDEPTTGLHFVDIEKLLKVLHRLVNAGNTVIVIEHNLSVLAFADWILEMGPEGGQAGGELIAEGTPEELVKNKRSITAPFLKEALASPLHQRVDLA